MKNGCIAGLSELVYIIGGIYLGMFVNSWLESAPPTVSDRLSVAVILLTYAVVGILLYVYSWSGATPWAGHGTQSLADPGSLGNPAWLIALISSIVIFVKALNQYFS